MTFSRSLRLAALVLFISAALIAFFSPNLDTRDILALVSVGLASWVASTL